MTFDRFENSGSSLIAPSDRCHAITPDDSGELAQVTKAIYVGFGGDLVVRPIRSEQDVTFQNLPSGCILDIRVEAVRATGTTASGLVALA
ncbi:spike base protein, RCAP_Rcc01079 family [Aurantiacibacter odishensis]|uniref:spike base protein, RCAP_Rcc01079 family n=1 Tax=Aurantiacibacter odishensis TaxID=1155476 RepID=UPI000E72A222|nr:hypothetical protein [Aurantiacibacter odishensis]